MAKESHAPPGVWAFRRAAGRRIIMKIAIVLMSGLRGHADSLHGQPKPDIILLSHRNYSARRLLISFRVKQEAKASLSLLVLLARALIHIF
jgi:hypothetical protein